MNHLVLLGDSILDNGSYTEGGPDVITHVSRLLPDGWLASLNATDGAVAQDIDAQLKALPGDATHLSR